MRWRIGRRGRRHGLVMGGRVVGERLGGEEGVRGEVRGVEGFGVRVVLVGRHEGGHLGVVRLGLGGGIPRVWGVQVQLADVNRVGRRHLTEEVGQILV